MMAFIILECAYYGDFGLRILIRFMKIRVRIVSYLYWFYLLLLLHPSLIVHLTMAELFTLVVGYKGKEYHLDSELRVYGYTHKIAINIEGEEILFEPDEERNYRAVIPDYEGSKTKIDIALIQAITKELGAAFND